MNSESGFDLPWFATEITVETMVRLLVTAVSLVGTFLAVFLAVSSVIFVRVQRISYVLSRAKVKFTRGVPDYLLARPTVTAALQTALENSLYNTVLIYGQRRSGKSRPSSKP